MRSHECYQWTAEVVADLRVLWESGLSSVKIAKRLGASKGSVIGKVHRLSLPKRLSPIVRSAPAQAIPQLAPALSNLVPLTVVVPPAALIPAEHAPKSAVSVADEDTCTVFHYFNNPRGRDGQGCHFIIGEPVRGKDWYFCSADLAETSKVYCCDHLARVFVPTRKPLNLSLPT